MYTGTMTKERNHELDLSCNKAECGERSPEDQSADRLPVIA